VRVVSGILSVATPTVTVELLGLARHRAGRPELVVGGRTIAEVLRAVGSACPGVADVLQSDGTVSRQYLVSVDGERFIEDASEAMSSCRRLLILGADSGG
jgi:molybdopterin converting factor small subunit